MNLALLLLLALPGRAAVTWTDSTLSEGAAIRAVHVAEARVAIDAARTAVGLSAATWTDPTLTGGSAKIRAVHITELRERIGEVYTTSGQSVPSWTDPTLTAGETKVRVVHIKEIRAAIEGAPVTPPCNPRDTRQSNGACRVYSNTITPSKKWLNTYDDFRHYVNSAGDARPRYCDFAGYRDAAYEKFGEYSGNYACGTTKAADYVCRHNGGWQTACTAEGLCKDSGARGGGGKGYIEYIDCVKPCKLTCAEDDQLEALKALCSSGKVLFEPIKTKCAKLSPPPSP
jgi:hypothetical protein